MIFKISSDKFQIHTIDGRNHAPVDMTVYPIIYKVLAPSQVVFSPDF